MARESDGIEHPDALDFTDVEVKSVLPSWTRDPGALSALFGPDGHEKLLRMRAEGRPGRKIVYLTYENPWGRSGGVAAVAAMLPDELRGAGETVLRLSPFHRRLKTTPAVADRKEVGRCSVEFEGDHEVSIYAMTDRQGREWFLFGAEGFFEADGGIQGSDCYVYSDEEKDDRDGDDSLLLRDALFAARAVPEVLRRLGRINNLVVHPQDWEFAAVALTVKEALLAGTLESASVLLTLHNPFDHSLSDENLGRITGLADRDFWPDVEGDARDTVLTRMIPLVDGPVSTVSRRFAQEFFDDPLQTGHFAGHYQGILKRQGIVGIDNGLFEQPRGLTAPQKEAIENALAGDTKAILAEKRKARKHLLDIFPEYLESVKDSIHGTFAAPAEDIPIFLMIGRLDPGQKGFDVFARAIESVARGAGRYVISPLSPLPDDASFEPFLDQLATLAKARAGEVVVIPFRLEFEVFLALRAGVTWSVWPSHYEPFGGVTEFYVHGTPVIARATGGLVQQVIDHGIDPDGASGILYREVMLESQAWQETDVHAMQTAAVPEGRFGNETYERQVEALRLAMTRATRIYQEEMAAYGRMLANLPGMCDRLSWERSVGEYRAWYDGA
jgi:glycogen synthase